MKQVLPDKYRGVSILLAEVLPRQTQAGSLRHLVAITALLLSISAEAIAQSKPEQLVPANFNARSDSDGQRWDIQSNGYIQNGTNSTFSSSFQLTVNNNSFSPNSQMMTADGTELVLKRTSPLNGIIVTRRVRVDPKKPFIRYCEIFMNPGSTPLTVQIQMQVRMGRGQFQTIISNKGNPIVNSLKKGDSGIAIWSQPQNQQQAVLLYMAGAKSTVLPTIQNQSNYYLYFRWNIKVPAGKTVTLVHFAAQKTLPTLPRGKKLEALFKPFKSRSNFRDLPAEIRKSIVNMSPGSLGSWDRNLPLTSLDSLGIEPGTTDILAIGESTALRGTLTFDRLSLETPFGEKLIAASGLAAIARPDKISGHGRVFMRDGEILSGKLNVKNLKFTMNTGLAVDLPVDQIDRLVMRELSEADRAADSSITGILETMDGDRIVLVAGKSVPIELVTPWGIRKFTLDDIERLEATKKPIGYRVGMRDGGRMFGFLKTPSFRLATKSFGVQELHPSIIRTLTMIQNVPEEEFDHDALALSHVVLKGENLLIGAIDLERVHFVTAGQRIPVPPNQLRNVQLVDNGGLAPIFEAVLWDGGHVGGEFHELVLPFRHGDNVAMVPVRDIIEIRVPSPTVPDGLRAKIRLLIRDLGSAEFETRESASKELAELGQLTRSQLSEAVRLSEDAEVRRRSEALLDNLD
jgi:hypothetical protein